MPANVYLLAILVALVHFASANFDLYRIHGQQDTTGSPWGTQPNGYMVFNNDPTCDDIPDPDQFWWERDDVSGDKIGVRCKGKKGCWVDDVTIYKDKGRQEGDTWMYPMLRVDNSKAGECFAYGGYGWDCRWKRNRGKRHQWGQRKFRCITGYESKDFNDCHHVGRIAATNNATAINSTAVA
ncbi:uncharacterized protein N0V89_012324 [Didymosphaeria variabile]|uniref:Uncharacterized protein n=1 Tax=Didymosphaeria variabile TaxID=1932322 RepID=A0A9W9C612_9PLEO|nr:uncharacterized protein N0V89_012324 [Didymosphaeria variabile]KAJ4344580.1 hypothetical protein N0V89_012324 [Didymosphaeria variabile]